MSEQDDNYDGRNPYDYEGDDWRLFVAMMEREGWKRELCADWFRFGKIAYSPDGKYWNNWRELDKVQHVGTWREWLAAGSSPVPF